MVKKILFHSEKFFFNQRYYQNIYFDPIPNVCTNLMMLSSAELVLIITGLSRGMYCQDLVQLMRTYKVEASLCCIT